MEPILPDPLSGPPSLQSLQRLLAAGPPEPEALGPLLADLAREQRLEHGWMLVKQARLDPRTWGDLQARLKAAADQARLRRLSQWQGDPARRQLRLQFEVRGPAAAAPVSGLAAVLARALMDAGLPVAMGLEKSPRPAVQVGHPLPLQAEGHGEWADAALLEPVATPLAELPARINAHAPEGLRILQCLLVPTYASKTAELCRRAHWRWSCPPERLEAAQKRMAAFLASDRFELERTGKVDGQKAAKRVDIRPLMEDCRWAGADLLFQTRIAPGTAANPRKLLAAIMGDLGLRELETPGPGLARLRLELAEDPRLDQAEKFEPKLHNMFEDAVALGAGGNIRIVEDDDDEPVRLG